jgi:hypothetical protein
LTFSVKNVVAMIGKDINHDLTRWPALLSHLGDQRQEKENRYSYK